MNKISINNANKVNEIRNSANKQLETRRKSEVDKHAPKQKSSADRIKVSGTAAEVQKLTARVAKLPDLRSEKVEQFKEAINNREYRPLPLDIANALISEEL